ncbi:enhanced serine sensitivity protein SseB C-terminal domain-containing protein [Rhodoplanes sp. Z2-YC6860]|uniref:enhanced serine sensitivity protein SseB C-terminal domain-containing protein n=1 Tax=Rhodoplanes sp. Z2-YC6860 TaxID=674703 RepID=UPI00078E0801|nr:enhanced serine sensitivity protein SseB C-terminal domain-containing protein [Rhodoplanes sp. Z2-YC6860]AMN44406.1 SseB family protein [Rhodoplanes sp. Z2-YC6860]
MFEPENDLERSLIRAVNDPAHRPDFLLRMLDAQTFIPLEIDGPRPPARPDGRVVLPPGAKLTFRTIRVGPLECLPFFSAASRARAKNHARSVLAPMATRELFERYAGRHFMLNPGHEHTQTFSADDIRRMLAGQFGKPAAPAQPAAKPAFEINLPPVEKSTATPTSAALAAAVTSPLVIQPAAAKAPEPKAPQPKAPEPNTFASEVLGSRVPESNASIAELAAELVPAELVPSLPPAAAKPAVENNLPSVQKPAGKTPEPKAPESSAPKQAAVLQPADPPWLIFNPQSEAAQAPPPSPTLPAAQDFSFDDTFVFGPAEAQKPEAVKPIVADNLPKPVMADSLEIPPATSPAAEDPAPNLQASVTSAPSAPIELQFDASKPSEAEKTGTIKTAMFDALAVLKRLAANKQASRRPQQADAAFARPIAPAETPVAAEPATPETPRDDEPTAFDIVAASQPAQLEPVQPAAPEAPAKPVEASPPPTPEKAANMAPSQAAVSRANTIPSDLQIRPAPSPAPYKPHMPSPPAVTIDKADPYPADVLLVLTMVLRDLPAIEAAHLAQVQSPGELPKYLVALKTSGDWEAVVLALGFKLQKTLPPNRRIEFTPLTGGMFDDYFRNQTQPFFKRH